MNIPEYSSVGLATIKNVAKDFGVRAQRIYIIFLTNMHRTTHIAWHRHK